MITTNQLKQPRVDRTPDFKHDEFDVYLDKMDSQDLDIVARPDKESTEWFYLDPFVGCARQYQHRKRLLGRYYRVKGFWSNTRNGSDCFLVDENGMEAHNPTHTTKEGE